MCLLVVERRRSCPALPGAGLSAYGSPRKATAGGWEVWISLRSASTRGARLHTGQLPTRGRENARVKPGNSHDAALAVRQSFGHPPIGEARQIEAFEAPVHD